MKIYYNDSVVVRLDNVDYLQKYIVLDCTYMRPAEKATFFRKAVEEIKPVPTAYGITVLYSNGGHVKVKFKSEQERDDAFAEMRTTMMWD